VEIDAALSRRVLVLCLHLCGNAADAEDALQETLLALHVARFRGESSVETFAYRVALRIALRIKSRRRRQAGEPSGEPAASGAGAIEAAADAAKVLRAMARLPTEQRAVLSLFALEGLKHKEIAEVLGVPEGTVWSRLHAARKRLQMELE
jgi:RNA polymerase sigma-70 factor (ECF subfamily)